MQGQRAVSSQLYGRCKRANTTLSFSSVPTRLSHSIDEYNLASTTPHAIKMIKNIEQCKCLR